MKGPIELSDDAVRACLDHVDETTRSGKWKGIPPFYLDMLKSLQSSIHTPPYANKNKLSALFNSQRAFVCRELKKFARGERYCQRNRGIVPKWSYSGKLIREYADKSLCLSVRKLTFPF